MENSFRLLSSKQALHKILPFRKQLGISRIANLSDFIDLDIYIVSAIRTKLNKGQVSSTQGKGRSLEQATCGALIEALERHCAAHFDPTTLLYTTLNEMSQNSTSLSEFGYDSYQDKLGWFYGEDLVQGNNIWLPALEVYFPYYGSEIKYIPIKPHTSGIACGANTEEATLFALFEVIERATSSTFLKNYTSKNIGKVIREESISNTKTNELLKVLQYQGYKIIIFNLNSILPTYYVLILDLVNFGPKFMVSGTSTHLSHSIALDAAILEAIQGLIVGLQGVREDLDRHHNLYEVQKNNWENLFYKIRETLVKNNRESSFNTFIYSPEDTKTAIEFIIDEMKKLNINKIYRCDLSNPIFPLSVVKVIVPALFDNIVNPNRGL